MDQCAFIWFPVQSYSFHGSMILCLFFFVWCFFVVQIVLSPGQWLTPKHPTVQLNYKALNWVASMRRPTAPLTVLGLPGKEGASIIIIRFSNIFIILKVVICHGCHPKFDISRSGRGGWVSGVSGQLDFWGSSEKQIWLSKLLHGGQYVSRNLDPNHRIHHHQNAPKVF